MSTDCKPSLVLVNRTLAIEASRAKLPAVLTEQEIIDAVRNNDFSIVCGDTGCGKSTQVPQFLYEAGFTDGEFSGMIVGVTQPRRVAAIAVADRVGVELNNASLVGYQVRYDKNINSKTMRIKFMTDGILLREIREDIRLPKYSVIVIDEAHERSINCDMLLGLLSGSVRARKNTAKPLKVVIMSATLRMTDFTENKYLFPNMSKSAPAVVQIDNRMHSVVVHYDRKTEDDYVAMAVEKVQVIHKTLPLGSVLIFVTGKAEVHKVCNAFRSGEFDDEVDDGDMDDDEEQRISGGMDEDGVVVDNWKRLKAETESNQPDFDLGVKSAFTEELCFRNGKAEVVETKSSVKQAVTPADNGKGGSAEKAAMAGSFTGGGAGSRLRVLPLYAQMSSDRQMKVFRASEEFPDDRIVVVATNVAETSLTIPNIRYVIDSGREKRKEFNSNGVSRFAVRFTSKASANQRAGRAGRVGPGHVYRLYSPNVFGEHMAEFASPEIETNPLDSSVLLLKSMGVPSFLNFPWPSPPPALHVEAAMRRLKAIGAISSDKKESVTDIGRQVSKFPVSPRLAVVLVHAMRLGDSAVLHCLLVAVAMLSVDCLLAVDPSTDPETAKGREILNNDFSDDIDMLITKFVLWMQLSGNETKTDMCHRHGLSGKAMEEANSLFKQLVRAAGIECDLNILTSAVKHGSVDRKTLRVIRECCLHGFIDQVAIREAAGAKTYRAPGCTDGVMIHRSSVMHRLRPHFLAYTEMQQASGEFGNNRRSMRVCFAVDPEYMATMESPLIDKSKPHAMLKPTVVNGRKIAWIVPRYTPLSVVISDCAKVDLGPA